MLLKLVDLEGSHHLQFHLQATFSDPRKCLYLIEKAGRAAEI